VVFLDVPREEGWSRVVGVEASLGSLRRERCMRRRKEEEGEDRRGFLFADITV